MKKKLPALILAMGMTAAPVFAKNTTRRLDDGDKYTKVEENKKKRIDNFGKRLKQIEAEKELIKETEAEIAEIVAKPIEAIKVKKSDFTQKINFDENETVILSEQMPINGIDLTDILDKINSQ